VVNGKQRMKSMKVADLTFDKLFDLIEENRFENETDRKIAELLHNAERDWRTSIETLNDFIEILKKEINGQVTKSNLNKLLDRYNRNLSKYAWESESVSYLLDILKLTEKSDLNDVFGELNKKIKTE